MIKFYHILESLILALPHKGQQTKKIGNNDFSEGGKCTFCVCAISEVYCGLHTIQALLLVSALPM